MRVRLRVERLQAILAASRLSQNHWAIKLGLSRGHWSDLVNGRHPYPSARTRERMLETFAVPLDELFEIESAPATPQEVEFRSAISHLYQIERELAQGGMGTVYVARDLAHGRLVAIKVMSPEAVCGIGADAFLREISLVARLQHPNILPLFASGVVAGHPYFVMPWIREGSLRDRLRRDTRLLPGVATAITRGVAAALGHAHAERILHCDVKPANILMHGDHPWLMDFGISRIVHSEASEWRARRGLDSSAGTPAYVSPEQANGEGDIDARADTYSLACVTYEMLTGRPPFEGPTTQAIVARRFLGPPIPISHLAPLTPEPIIEAVTHAMAVDRAYRTATPEGFSAELASAAQHAPGPAEKVALATTRVMNRLRARAGLGATGRGGALSNVARDLRMAYRSLARAPRFVLAFVLPLAVSLGAGTTFYAITDQVLHRASRGVVQPRELVRLAVAKREVADPFRSGNTNLAWIDYDQLRRDSVSLAAVAAYQRVNVSQGRGEQSERLPAMLVTPSYFPMLGVAPAQGRFYSDDEDRVSAAHVPCVVGYEFWKSRLGGAATGQELDLNTLRCTVVGVAPAGFTGTSFERIDIWLPLRAAAWASMGPEENLWNTDRSHWLEIIARRRPGASDAAIMGAATRSYRELANRTRDPKLEGRVVIEPAIGGAGLAANMRVRMVRWLSAGTAVLVLLVLLNLVNLLLSRNLERGRELAVRLALGGTRARLFHGMAMEALLLAALSAALSVGLAWFTGPLVRSLVFPGIDFAQPPLTVRVALVAWLTALAVALVVSGLSLAQLSRADPARLLNGGGRSTGTRRSRHGQLALVALQAALSMALLVASAAFVRSFRSAAGTELGFDIGGLAYMDLPLEEMDTTFAGRVALAQLVRERLAATPGIASATLGYMIPWRNNRTNELFVPGRDSLPRVQLGQPLWDEVTPEYMRTMGLALRLGRFVSREDRAGSAPVMVVNEALARLYWGGASQALGQCIMVGKGSVCRTIVGVTVDHRLTGALDGEPVPAYFLPVAQAAEYGVTPKVIVRVRGDAGAQLTMIRRVAQRTLPAMHAVSVETMQSRLDPLLAGWRVGAAAFTAIGAIAVLVAMAGLFSVLAFLIAERRREFAIRAAIGAQVAQLVVPVVKQGALVIVAGALVGIVVARGAASWLQPSLFHTELLDVRTVSAVMAALVAIGMLASIGPARRAGTVNPQEALRGDG
ncbi:MAG: permease [Gemmatimonadetes bacterium]|nr:permease [Gemmatimonadota bacterium]